MKNTPIQLKDIRALLETSEDYLLCAICQIALDGCPSTATVCEMPSEQYEELVTRFGCDTGDAEWNVQAAGDECRRIIKAARNKHPDRCDCETCRPELYV